MILDVLILSAPHSRLRELRLALRVVVVLLFGRFFFSKLFFPSFISFYRFESRVLFPFLLVFFFLRDFYALSAN